MAAMDDTTTSTTSSQASHQSKMFAAFPILYDFSDPYKKSGGSIDTTLYFKATDRQSDIVRKFRQQLAAAGIRGNAMEATGGSVKFYKDTLRLLFQRHTPNSSRGRTGGSISAVQVETSLAGGHVGPQTDSSSFVILIDALRHFDACCLKVLEFYINKSKVQHLTQCFKHGNQPSALTQEPSRLLTEQERQHPLVSALTGRTKEQLKNLCSALSGAKEHNLGAASDTRMTMMQIWEFKTPFHVGPVASARKLENLVGSLPPSDNFSVDRPGKTR